LLLFVYQLRERKKNFKGMDLEQYFPKQQLVSAKFSAKPQTAATATTSTTTATTAKVVPQLQQTQLGQFYQTQSVDKTQSAAPSATVDIKFASPLQGAMMANEIVQRRTLLSLWNEVMYKLQILSKNENNYRVFWGYFFQVFLTVFGHKPPIIDRIGDCVAKQITAGFRREDAAAVWRKSLRSLRRENDYFNIGIEVGEAFVAVWKWMPVKYGLNFHRFQELVQACLVSSYLMTLPPVGASFMMQKVNEIAYNQTQRKAAKEANDEAMAAQQAEAKVPRVWPPQFIYPAYPNPAGPPKSVYGNPIIPPMFKAIVTPLVFPPPPPPPPPPLSGGTRLNFRPRPSPRNHRNYYFV
jgi:hypothetical protein